MNRTLKTSEQGKAKQCFDVDSCSSLHQIHVANKRSSGFSPVLPTLFEQKKNIYKKIIIIINTDTYEVPYDENSPLLF